MDVWTPFVLLPFSSFLIKKKKESHVEEVLVLKGFGGLPGG